MKTILNILDTIGLVIVAAIAGVDAAIAYAKASLRGPVGKYLQGLAVLAVIMVFGPMILVAVGVIGDWPWVTASAGLISALALFVLSLRGAILGTLIGTLQSLSDQPSSLQPGFHPIEWLERLVDQPGRIFRAAGDGAMRYVRFVRGVILYELIVSLILVSLPIRDNLGKVSIILLGVAVIIFAIYHWGLDTGVWRKLAFSMAVGTVTVGIISMFVPLDGILSALTERARVVGGVYTKEIKAGSEEIRTNGISGVSTPSTAGAVALLMPPGDDLVIPPGVTFVKVTMTATNAYSGWINIPHEWGWVDVWSSTGSFWLQELGESRPRPLKNNDPVVLKRGPFRVSGEVGYFYLKRKT